MGHLSDLEIFRYRLPLRGAVSLGPDTIRHREGLLLRATSSTGAVGWGDVAPLPRFSRETVDDAGGQLQELRTDLTRTLSPNDAADAVAAGDPTRFQAVNRWTLYPSVRFGLEQALLWLHAAEASVPVPALLRNGTVSSLPLNRLLTGQSTERLEQAAANALELGYRSVKLKVGREPAERDITAVHTLDKVLDGRAGLRLDANRAWTFEQARRFADNISDCRVEYVEEPLADPDRLSTLDKETTIPIALDETTRAIPPQALRRYSFAKALVLKPTLLGGFARTAEYVKAAEEHDLMPVLSASYESGLGLLGLAWLAVGLTLEHVPAGLDTWRSLREDLLIPRLRARRGRIEKLDVPPAEFDVNDRFLSPLP